MTAKASTPARQSSIPTLDETIGGIASHAVFMVSPEGKITSWNAGAERISGWSRDAIIGQPLHRLYARGKANEKQVQATLQQARDEGTFVAEHELCRHDGESYLAEISITAFSVMEQLQGYMVIAQDTTQRKQEEDDQLDANSLLREEIKRRKAIERALQESNSELDAFASAAGHDLQEPLRMVVSYLQLIKKRYANSFDQDGLEFLDFAMDGATRMKQLINDLVEYSRIETLGKPFKKTDANVVLSKVLDSLEVYIDETRAKITHDTLPVIWSDEVQLNELLQNLIANAIKFGKKGEKKAVNRAHRRAGTCQGIHLFGA